MYLFVKLIGAAVLAALAVAAVGVWDLAANDGRLFYRLAGRDSLVQDCTPPLRETLIGKGYSPVDLALDDAPSVSFASGSFGRHRSLSVSFSFSDGQDGPRVDGHLLCTVRGQSVQVDVDTDALPRRVT